jgi:hypothetical protein
MSPTHATRFGTTSQPKIDVELKEVQRIAADANHLAVVAVARTDATIHASLVSAGLLEDPVSHEPSIGIIVSGSATKLSHLRRVRRAAIVFQSGYTWTTVDGRVRIVGPDDPDDSIDSEVIPSLLRRVFLAAGGNHENWTEFDHVMAVERRAAVFVRVERILTDR